MVTRDHDLWRQVVRHEKRDNRRFKQETNAYDLQKANYDMGRVQQFKMKKTLYGKHMHNIIRATGIDPVSHDSPQKDLLRETSNQH